MCLDQLAPTAHPRAGPVSLTRSGPILGGCSLFIYVYASDSPVNITDASGLASACAFGLVATKCQVANPIQGLINTVRDVLAKRRRPEPPRPRLPTIGKLAFGLSVAAALVGFFCDAYLPLCTPGGLCGLDTGHPSKPDFNDPKNPCKPRPNPSPCPPPNSGPVEGPAPQPTPTLQGPPGPIIHPPPEDPWAP